MGQKRGDFGCWLLENILWLLGIVGSVLDIFLYMLYNYIVGLELYNF